MDGSDHGGNERDSDTVDVGTALSAGAALFNEGYVLAAHDPWEEAWLPLDPDTDGDNAADERLLHGLIAAAAATHHAVSRNWSGATGCATNAVEYLGAVDTAARGVAVPPVHEWCRRLAVDPETVERARPPAIRIDDAAPGFDDLGLRAALLAAPVLAGEIETGTEATLERAAELAREERGTGRTAVAELLFAYLREPETRPQVTARLTDRVELADRKRRDVDDLF